MTQQVSILTYHATPVADIAAKRGVTFAGEQATAGQACMGVANAKIEAGTTGKVNLGPTAIWETGAAITGTELRLMADANGRVITWTTGNAVVAKRIKGRTAAGAGEMMEVFVIQSEA